MSNGNAKSPLSLRTGNNDELNSAKNGVRPGAKIQCRWASGKEIYVRTLGGVLLDWGSVGLGFCWIGVLLQGLSSIYASTSNN